MRTGDRVGHGQHGAGRRHERHVALEGWQLLVTHAHAGSFVRGLIHSDGCRYIARQRCRNGKVYAYERYAFKNKSSDILRIFTDHLRLLDVQYRQSGDDLISINRRADVARLDQVVGPKY